MAPKSVKPKIKFKSVFNSYNPSKASNFCTETFEMVSTAQYYLGEDEVKSDDQTTFIMKEFFIDLVDTGALTLPDGVSAYDFTFTLLKDNPRKTDVELHYSDKEFMNNERWFFNQTAINFPFQFKVKGNPRIMYNLSEFLADMFMNE